MKKFIIIILTLHVSILTFHTSEAQIIHVPADQPTIQAGINAAVDGDTVLVAEGTYLENINFSGKAILVASHFIMDADTSHINHTVIDGSQPTNPDHGAVATFNSGEDTTSVLCGFTITGGTGLLVSDFNMRIGGGIAGSSSGFKILNNKILGNQVNHLTYAGGGGIGCISETVEKWMVIKDNLVSGNSCTANFTEAFGGGVWAGANLVLENNEICANTCTATSALADGGGVDVGSWNITINIKIQNNFIHDNLCDGEDSPGPGIWLYGSYGIVSGNQIRNNKGVAGESGLGDGGGIYIQNSAGTIEISGNEIIGNSLEGFQARGGGVMIYGSEYPVFIENNIFGQDTLIASDRSFGGGIFSWLNYQVSIIGNHFMNNYLEAPMIIGGGICVDEAQDKTVIKYNTIIANTGSGQGFGGGLAFFSPVDVLMEIDGNYFENNNMSAGGGIYTFNCYNIQVSNNVLKDNHASGWGGGCRLKYNPGRSEEHASLDLGHDDYTTIDRSTREVRHPLLINNTFLNNTSNQGGAIYCDHQDEFPLIINSIFWGNTATVGDNIYYLGQDSLLVSHCDINDSINSHIYGKWKGAGNFYEDPGFCDTLCHIQGGSLCVDAGVDSLEFNGTWYYAPDHDCDGTTRPFLEGVDIGADEYDNTGYPETRIQHSTFNIQTYPNPTSGNVTCHLSLVTGQWVKIEIFDLYGREIATVLDARLPEGEHVVQYDLTGQPDGIYLVRLTAGEEVISKKVLKSH